MCIVLTSVYQNFLTKLSKLLAVFFFDFKINHTGAGRNR